MICRLQFHIVDSHYPVVHHDTCVQPGVVALQEEEQGPTAFAVQILLVAHFVAVAAHEQEVFVSGKSITIRLSARRFTTSRGAFFVIRREVLSSAYATSTGWGPTWSGPTMETPVCACPLAQGV